MMWSGIACPARVMAIAAQEPSQRKVLLASGVVDALQWSTVEQHDFPFFGKGLAQFAAIATVTLIVVVPEPLASPVNVIVWLPVKNALAWLPSKVSASNPDPVPSTVLIAVNISLAV